MRAIIISALFVMFLGGCANTRLYGNFLDNSEAIDQQIASDTVQQIVLLYPPGQTLFSFLQPTPDPFGMALVTGLRQKGYALREFSPNSKGSSETNNAAEVSGIPVNYVLDRTDGSLCRLIVMIGKQSISRPYTTKDGEVSPAGYWVRKE